MRDFVGIPQSLTRFSQFTGHYHILVNLLSIFRVISDKS